MVAKKFQNPKGGLNEAGRKFLKEQKAVILKDPLSQAQVQEEYPLHQGLLE